MMKLVSPPLLCRLFGHRMEFVGQGPVGECWNRWTKCGRKGCRHAVTEVYFPVERKWRR